MIEGKITSIDLERRTVGIMTRSGERLELAVPASLIVEICEPGSMGTTGGALEDLEEGYLVELDVESHADGTHTCASLVCVS